jgi:hypothetical protein
VNDNDSMDTTLEVFKRRGEQPLEEAVKLIVGKQLSIDTSRDIA